jgi:hypothetical protein
VLSRWKALIDLREDVLHSSVNDELVSTADLFTERLSIEEEREQL